MRLHGLQAAIRFVAAGTVMMLGAYQAQAGIEFVGPTTVHIFKAQIKGAVQGEKTNGDDIVARASANQRTLAEDCLGRSLSRSEKIVLVTDCGAPDPNSTSVVIAVVDTDVPKGDPAIVVQYLGGGDLDRIARTENRDGETTKAEYVVRGGFGGPGTCPGAALFVQLEGYARVSSTRLDRSSAASPICAESASGRWLGRGDFGSAFAVVESASFSAGSRSKKIVVDANDINALFNPP